MRRNDLAARLLATFLGELDQQVRGMNADLLALEAAPGDAERVKSLFRAAHTIKGAARAAGVPLIEEAAHDLETLLAEARERKIVLGPGHFALLFRAADALADAGRRTSEGRDLADSALAALREPLRAAGRGAVSAAKAEPALSPAALVTGRGDGELRVRGEKLDALLADSGQLRVSAERVAARPKELDGLHEWTTRWAADWRREGRRLRVELERSGLTTTAGPWLKRTEENLTRLVRETSGLATKAGEDARALERISGEVALGVRELRMRPVADACEALPRVVRDLAAAAGKEASLEIKGGEVEADRSVLEGLAEALLQLVRNAVDHGIEPPAARQAAGKPRRGLVTVAAALRGDRLVVSVSDDGAGLDVAAIRERLALRGLSLPVEERELVRELLAGGVSTRTEVTPISGRGVGLDVVRAAVERIRGSVSLSWVGGRGTTCTLECPPTLATLRAVLVAVGQQVLVLPAAHVERLLRVGADQIRRAEGRDVVTTGGGPVPLVALARLLPPLVEKPAPDPVPVVVLTAGERRLAVAVDELLAEQEVLMRPVPRAATSLPLVAGATMLATGRVALVLSPATLIAAGLGSAPGAALAVGEGRPGGPAKRRLLVVDDSITTRTLEQSILEAAGYEVLTAVDGAEGWRLLEERGAELVVADIEMPRMDGFALCQAIRSSSRFKELPVVLVTALETPEHRSRGLEVGADAFIGKSSFDQEHLLDTIRQLLG